MFWTKTDISIATQCLQFLRKILVILLPYLGLQRNQVAKRLKSCVHKFYSFVNLKIIFQSTRCIKSFFPYKDRINRRLHDRKIERLKALAKNDNTLAIADRAKPIGHNIKWDHFDILAKGKTDYHCKIRDFIYSGTWASFQRQRWKWKVDALLHL